jgi:hypothetical protein
MSMFSSPPFGSLGRPGTHRVYGPTDKYWHTSLIRIVSSGFLSDCDSNRCRVESSYKMNQPSFHFLLSRPLEKKAKLPVFSRDPIKFVFVVEFLNYYERYILFIYDASKNKFQSINKIAILSKLRICKNSGKHTF